MGKFFYSSAASLDGYVEDPEGDFSWAAPDEQVHRHANDRTEESGLVIMGRRLYETMEPFWSEAAADPTGSEHVDEFARIWVRKPKLVFSRTLGSVPEPFGLIRELDPEWAAELRDKVEGTITVGGASLASAFAAAGLIDEVELITVPFVAGGGKPFFGPGFRGRRLEPLETRRFDGGSVAARYAVS